MRWTFLAPFIASYLTSSVDGFPILETKSVLDTFPIKPLLGKRVPDCIDLRGNIKAKDCVAALSSNGFVGAFFFDDDKKGFVRANTNLNTDAVVTEIPESAKLANMKFTCDHILELNILKTIINRQGGACDAAEALEDQGLAKTKLENIRRIVNRAENLVSFKASVENIKTKHTQKFQGENPSAGSIGSDMGFLAMTNYLEKTLSKTRETARLLDKAINDEFPGATTGVSELWDTYIAFTKAEALIRRASAQKDINAKKAKAEATANRKNACNNGPDGGAPPPARSATPPTKRRMVRRRMSAFSPAPITQLERRAVRGAARSGPNAPPAPSCPLPGAPRKRVVPRSQARIKPQATNVRRTPVAQPAPRAPRQKKTVARPANRPRRTPGQAAPPRKRVTPRQKPRTVPKPRNRSRGTPRARRGRR